jgi:hypothetical protein
MRVVFCFVNIVNIFINIFKLHLDIFNYFCYNWNNNVMTIHELSRQ